MATGISKNGTKVSVNDHVSILAKVVSVSGSGSLATVVCQCPLDTGTVSVKANDAVAVQQLADTDHPAVSFVGKRYGFAGDDITILGVVTAITGSGLTAQMTVKLVSSGNSITTATGNATSVAEVS